MEDKLTLKVVRLNKTCAEIMNEDSGRKLGRYQLCNRSTIVIDGQLSINLIKAYESYYKGIIQASSGSKKELIKKSSLLEAIVMDNRALLICEIATGATIAVFKLARVENLILDARFINKLVTIFEGYYRELDIDFGF